MSERPELPEVNLDELTEKGLLLRIARDQRELLLHVRDAVRYMKEAEKEVPEFMRRFMMFMHDLHDISYMYTEMGHEPPPWIKREMERCDDRLRILLQDLHKEGEVFSNIRKDMAQYADENRWDHTKKLEFKR